MRRLAAAALLVTAAARANDGPPIAPVTPTMPPASVRIESYDDGDRSDWAPEFQAFLDDPAKPHALVLAAREYHIDSEIRICRQVEIAGEGYGRTRIRAHAQLSPIVLAHGADPACGGQLGSQYSWVHGLTLVSDGTPQGLRTAGIVVEARARVSDVHVSGAWAHGVLISADHTRERPSNANGWTLERVRTTGARHAGIYVQGGDSNVGVAMQVDATSNCVAPAEYTGIEPCAGIVDDSFLGCTWIAPHTAGHGAYPGMRQTGASARSVWIGAYREVNQDPISPMRSNSISLGGVNNWTGGIVLLNGKIYGAELVAPRVSWHPKTSERTPIIFRLQTAPGRWDAHLEGDGKGWLRWSHKSLNAETTDVPQPK